MLPSNKKKWPIVKPYNMDGSKNNCWVSGTTQKKNVYCMIYLYKILESKKYIA